MTDSLTRSRPSLQGVDPTALLGLVNALDSSGHEPHSLMVLRHGHVIAEGWWGPYRRDVPHLLYSLSKAFTSLVVGALVDDGVLGLDDPILDHLDPARNRAWDERFEAVTLRHALTMTSGHSIDQIIPMFLWVLENPGGDWLDGLMSLPPDREPGSVFAYNQFCTFVLARIAAERTGRRLLDLARDRFLDHLDPTGARDARWLNPGGFDLGFSGLHVRTEMIAALGQLCLQRGRWGDAQLVSESWIDAATSLQVRNDGDFRSPGDPNPEPDWNSGYGYQFWICRHGYRGDGALGQFAIVWPEEDVVIATTASAPDMQGLLDLIDSHLGPAILDGESPQSGSDRTEAAEAELTDRLASLTLAVPDDSGAPVPVGSFSRRSGSGDVPTVSGIELALDAGRRVLRIDHASGVAEVEVGSGSWVDGTWPAHAGRPGQPIAAAGGVDGTGSFRADVVFLQTPHRLHVSLDPTSGIIDLGWNQFPLHGSDPSDFVPT